MVARLALAAALVFAAAPITAQGSDAEDPYIWLEEIQGERALAEVDQWNADTEAVLTAQAEYPLAKAWARQILDDTRQIAMPDAIMGDQVTNLWRDADNPRGLWRTATLQSYLAGAPEWRTLIDVDQLAQPAADRIGQTARDRPRGQGKLVIGNLAVAHGHGLGQGVDGFGGTAQQKLDIVVGVIGRGAQEEPLKLHLAGQVFLRQRRALIGRAGFLADQRNLPLEPFAAQFRDQRRSGLPGPDNHNMRHSFPRPRAYDGFSPKLMTICTISRKDKT